MVPDEKPREPRCGLVCPGAGGALAVFAVPCCRKCPSQNCGKQQVDEEFCVKCLAVLCSEEEEKGEEEGGSVSSCLVSANAVTQLKRAERLAAMLALILTE